MLTHDVYARVFEGHLEAKRIDQNFDAMRQASVWGYYATPVLVLVRVSFVALTLQLLILLLDAHEVRFAAVFRAVLLGYFASLYGVILRVAYVGHRDVATLSQADFSVVPLSLGSWLLSNAEFNTPRYILLSFANVAELLWMVVVATALVQMVKLKRRTAIATVASAWTILTAIQWALMVIVARLSSPAI